MVGPRTLPGLLAALALLCAGCGSSAGDLPVGSEPVTPEPSISARIAVAGPVEVLDPLHARSRAERLISRQVFEPLQARLDPPFGEEGRRRGPARSLGPSSDGSTWSFELRPGVSFHDDSSFNADAVIVNVQRWFASGIAGTVIPEVTSVDSPVPGQVRFQLSEPVPDLPARLSDGRLGLVSPASIAAVGTEPVGEGWAGTGAFELRELTPDGALLAGSADWWGSEVGLGPGVERIEVTVGETAATRLERLEAGVVEIADRLGGAEARELRTDPLLTAIGRGRGVTIGLQRSVRGIESTRPDQPLNDLGLTTLR